ncbi:hypothetical protein OS175_08585 [Marinicella sp. S1101]|uniref:hypothetical protein n=1 Tax=Marinicella marina TaxID=2996016 RepID=UPI00226104B0|nr:hypothetical protein [Marinicella marina]MCX7553934.1 hypothetical protein [Marinicella marina]
MSVQPEQNSSQGFLFKSWQFNQQSGELTCHYCDAQFGDFTETFIFANVDQARYLKQQKNIDAAIDCLFWMAGVSYYKTALAKSISFQQNTPSKTQAQWLTDTWQAGLAELAHENNLGWLDWVKIEGNASAPEPMPCDLRQRSLVAIGGGKDSLVSIEAIKAAQEEACLFLVGQSEFILSVAEKTNLPIMSIQRQVDKKLAQVNQQGAYNGHIPITAINACVAVVAALLYDFDSVVFSNERSADVGNLQIDSGQWINHQYSKSLAYERNWQLIIKTHVAEALDCFSLLRPFSELAIIKRFASLEKYFAHFSSCNRNFHLTGSQNANHHWCGICPKCAFVFLCLAPFVSRQQLLDIFQQNLFDNKSLSGLFDSLLGIEGIKPFECVGEQQECRLAVTMLRQHPDWQDHPKIIAWSKIIPTTTEQDAMLLMQPSSDHNIPAKRNFRQVIQHET